MVWDGARSHRREKVKCVGLSTIMLPPYSPELNPADRAFEEVWRWVEGMSYPMIEGKVEAYQRRLESDPLGCDRLQAGIGCTTTSAASTRLLRSDLYGWV